MDPTRLLTQFPMTSELVDLWRKDGQRGEMIIYELLARHPRIVAYHDHDPVTFELLLQHLPKGDLEGYLLQHPELPFQNRLAWAVEIAQGIAHLHSKDVWNDIHLGNVLVSDDLHVVLCDFGGSYVKPDRQMFFDIGPPLPYICPDGYYGLTSKRQDIFGFGVMLFVVLSKRYPHCPTRGFAPPTTELVETFHLHHNFNFDALPDAIYPHFAQIINKCFNISYQSAAELLLDLEEAYSSWIQKFEKGDVQDPDVHISDTCGTIVVRGIQSGPAPLDPACHLAIAKVMADMRSNPDYSELFKIAEENSAKMRSTL